MQMVLRQEVSGNVTKLFPLIPYCSAVAKSIQKEFMFPKKHFSIFASICYDEILHSAVTKLLHSLEHTIPKHTHK